MKLYDKLSIINKTKYLNDLNGMIYLCNVDDAIKYGQNNSKCYHEQLVNIKSNYDIKYYLMMLDVSNKNYNKSFVPLCLTDLFRRGLNEYYGYYIVHPRLKDLSSVISFWLNNEVKYYKFNLNSEFISNYIRVNDDFTTAPYIFSSENKLVIYCYNEHYQFINKYKLEESTNENNLIVGILVEDN